MSGVDDDTLAASLNGQDLLEFKGRTITDLMTFWLSLERSALDRGIFGQWAKSIWLDWEDLQSGREYVERIVNRKVYYSDVTISAGRRNVVKNITIASKWIR